MRLSLEGSERFYEVESDEQGGQSVPDTVTGELCMGTEEQRKGQLG